MLNRPSSDHQPDLLVRATNTLDPNRIPAQIRAEVVALLKLLIAQHIVVDEVPPCEVADE
jgi:hypothetical protein